MTQHKQEPVFEITIWGARGSLPAPGPDFAKAGGNTNCVQVKCANENLIFDAGTGIRELGSKLATEEPDSPVHLFLSHAHYDHVEGLPFFAPFFIDNKKIDIYCGKLDGAENTQAIFSNLMKRPYFPVCPKVFSADITYLDVKPGEHYTLSGGAKITTGKLNHPGGATSYRIDYNGRSFAYVTDTEHKPGEIDQNIVDIIQDVDSFIYDCSLTDEEYPDFVNYGHSTYEEGLRLQEIAGAGQLIATHHMPFRIDRELDRIEERLQQANPNNIIAREGLVINL